MQIIAVKIFLGIFLGANYPRSNYACNKLSERRFFLEEIVQGEIVREELPLGQLFRDSFLKAIVRGLTMRGQSSKGQFSSGIIVRWAIIQTQSAKGAIIRGETIRGAIFLGGNYTDTILYLWLINNFKFKIFLRRLK